MVESRRSSSRWPRTAAVALASGVALVAIVGLNLGCHGSGPRTPATITSREIDVADVGLRDGYRVEVVVSGLTFPSCVFLGDDGLGEDGAVHVVECGYCYGEAFTTPRILRIAEDGNTVVVAKGDETEGRVWTGAVQIDGKYYVAASGVPGRVLRIANGVAEVLVAELPPLADHHLNPPVLGPDGWLYLGQGSATNSGVVGIDNAKFGWLRRTPAVHEVPGQDLSAAGREYESENPLTDEDDSVRTSAYAPFGVTQKQGEVIQGAKVATGVIYRIQPESGALEVHATGLRNPYGLEFDAAGALYAVENGFDRRGSRPVFGAPDCIWRIRAGHWYGFPDYAAGIPLTDPRFDAGDGPPGFVLALHPEKPPPPAVVLPVHASASGIAIARDEAFGPRGMAYVAQFGDMSPGVGEVYGRIGFDVLRVDLESGIWERFATNRGDENGPASALGKRGLERPVDVCFDASGTALYVLDFGIVEEHDGKVVPRMATGALFRITRGAPR